MRGKAAMPQTRHPPACPERRERRTASVQVKRGSDHRPDPLASPPPCAATARRGTCRAPQPVHVQTTRNHQVKTRSKSAEFRPQAPASTSFAAGERSSALGLSLRHTHFALALCRVAGSSGLVSCVDLRWSTKKLGNLEAGPTHTSSAARFVGDRAAGKGAYLQLQPREGPEGDRGRACRETGPGSRRR